MIEKINRNFLAEKVEKLETHKYSPEQNKLHFTGTRFKVSTPGCVTLESAIEVVLKTPTAINLLAYLYFGNEYIKWKILNNKSLTDNEIDDFIQEDFFPEVNRTIGENRRWSRWITIVKEIDGRFFEVGYDQGLTESQPNSYSEQPVEVFKTETVVTKTVTSYKKKNE